MDVVAVDDIDVLETSPEAKLRIKEMITAAIQRSMKAPPKLNLVEWADEFRYLPDNSAEAGRWKTARVEVARKPMLSISDPEAQEVTMMCCIQLAKTELMINTALYYIHQEPSPIMYVAPKKETAEAWSKERLVKSVNCTPVISDVFAHNRRGEGNTITQKQFAGGQISIVSARNPTDLAMRACRIMLFDECDKYPINVGAGESGSGGEGDPITVAWGRSTTYGRRAKKITACSPTVEGKSRIAQEYANSNMSEYHQKCRHCGESHVLNWTNVNIPKDGKTGAFLHDKAAIVCKSCGSEWTESDRHYSIREGHWVARKPEVTWHHGYKVSALASPFTPINVLAREFADAQNNPEALKAFYNTRMAETWKEVGMQPEWERIYENREDYKTCEIPDGALLVTCGIDVQKDYLVYEVTGWGRKKQSWSIDKGIIQGSIEDEETKERLSDFLDRTYPNSKKVRVPIMMTCIDSGYQTQEVYSFCRGYGSDRVVPVKGEDNLKMILGTPSLVDVMMNGKRLSRGIKLWKVGVSVAKEQIYRWLNAKKPTDEQVAEGREYPSGYSRFPMYDEEYFKQLTAEQYITKVDNRGFHSHHWEKLRKDNHFLDCRVYSRAGSAMLQIDRMTEANWVELEDTYLADIKVVKDSEPAPKPKTVSSSRRKSNWIKRA
jgi:phage terminase large subunit GpA-like protein